MLKTKKLFNILRACNSIRQNHKIVKHIINLGNKSVSIADTSDENVIKKFAIDSIIKDSLDLFKGPSKVNQVFWLDSIGNEMYNWTSDSFNAPLGNFGSRNYFSKIINNKAYYVDGDTSKKFFLDQVVSWTSGTFRSIISIPANSSTDKVAAISFNMRSVQDAILPTGMSFAIIDNKGKVLYHSVKSRNLNENVMSEFSDSANIASCIDVRAEGEFISRYYSKDYSVRITPLNDMPYFLIVFPT